MGLNVIFVNGTDHVGEIQAWDMNTGKKVWTRTFESHNWGPILTTGGGLTGNLPRIFPSGCHARIELGSWTVPPIFRVIQKMGRVDDDEMQVRGMAMLGLANHKLPVAYDTFVAALGGDDPLTRALAARLLPRVLGEAQQARHVQQRHAAGETEDGGDRDPIAGLGEARN